MLPTPRLLAASAAVTLITRDSTGNGQEEMGVQNTDGCHRKVKHRTHSGHRIQRPGRLGISPKFPVLATAKFNRHDTQYRWAEYCSKEQTCQREILNFPFRSPCTVFPSPYPESVGGVEGIRSSPIGKDQHPKGGVALRR